MSVGKQNLFIFINCAVHLIFHAVSSIWPSFVIFKNLGVVLKDLKRTAPMPSVSVNAVVLCCNLQFAVFHY